MGMLCRGCHHSQCSNIFSSESTGPIKAKLHMEHPKEGGTKVCIIGPGHMTKMATRAIYMYIAKIFKNLLLRNQWTDFNDTWFVALGTLAHLSIYKS